jgi:hypothetical protein
MPPNPPPRNRMQHMFALKRIPPGVMHKLQGREAVEANGRLNVSFSPGGSARSNGGMQM